MNSNGVRAASEMTVDALSRLDLLLGSVSMPYNTVVALREMICDEVCKAYDEGAKLAKNE